MFSTPVARYSTTRPTPESAYTPPNASPMTMNGLTNCQSTPNTLNASTLIICSTAVQVELLLPRAGLGDRLVDRLEVGALGLHDDVARLVVDDDVRVVRDVVGELADVERLAEDVRLLVLQRDDRCDVGLRLDRPLDAEERVHRELPVEEAQLRERLRRDLRRALLQHLEHQGGVGPDLRVDVREFVVDPEVTVERRRELARHERVRDRGRRAPLHLVDDALRLRRLHEGRRGVGREVDQDAAAV